MRKLISPTNARIILDSCDGVEADFHTLTSLQVDLLLTYADERRYHKPKNANGSRARYFHAYLKRRATANP